MLPDNISDWLQLIASGSCMALLVAAAIGDVKRYRISNNLVGAVIACFVVLAAAKASWIFVGWSLAAAACVFLVTSLLFAFGLFGGGDTKLTAAMALWIQFIDLPRFLLVMTATGGLLGIVWMIRRRRQQGADSPGERNSTDVAADTVLPRPADASDTVKPLSAKKMPNKLPYGVAIAAAGLDFFLFSPNSPLAGLLSIQ
jgi:prepilin peptidase CpaA